MENERKKKQKKKQKENYIFICFRRENQANFKRLFQYLSNPLVDIEKIK